MEELIIFGLVIALALGFDFTNGMHDTANAIASAVGTRAMTPRNAVIMAALLNFVGALISVQVALTIGKGIVDANLVTPEVLLGALSGAIIWNTITWAFGLPSSSSHALIGGLIGASIAAAGPTSVVWPKVVAKVALPSVIAPTLGFLGAIALVGIAMRISRRSNPRKANDTYKKAQWFSSGWLALTHGMNDAQKTMGIMLLAVISLEGIDPDTVDTVPYWIRISAASAMALGTYMGGWRIIKTLGSRVAKIDPVQGFAASTSSAATLFLASRFGIPVSTTHTVTGGVLGAGAGKRVSSVRWQVVRGILMAWVVTLPAAGAVGAMTYYVTMISPYLTIVGGGILLYILKRYMAKSHEDPPTAEEFIHDALDDNDAPKKSYASPQARMMTRAIEGPADATVDDNADVADAPGTAPAVAPRGMVTSNRSAAPTNGPVIAATAARVTSTASADKPSVGAEKPRVGVAKKAEDAPRLRLNLPPARFTDRSRASILNPQGDDRPPVEPAERP